MKPIFAPMARPAIMVPSMTACGSCRKMTWSLQVPGSDSSPLTRTYLGFSETLGTNDHFMPVGKPAPPRPRRPEAFMVLMIHSGPSAMARWVALYPSSSRYLSMSVAPRPNRLERTFTSSGWEASVGMLDPDSYRKNYSLRDFLRGAVRLR